MSSGTMTSFKKYHVIILPDEKWTLAGITKRQWESIPYMQCCVEQVGDQDLTHAY
jgi:hypothetical protein